jgi:hypothetical protein
MNRFASANSFARLLASSSPMRAELLTHAILNPCAAITFFVASIVPGANAGCEGRSIFPSSPRSSTAENPCPWAKSRIFGRLHVGHPKVENAMGNGFSFVSPSAATAVAAPNAARKLRRVDRAPLQPAIFRSIATPARSELVNIPRLKPDCP